MAPKGAKRAAAKAAAPAPKVQKQDPEARLLDVVKDVVEQSPLTESCRAMLVATLPSSLTLPTEKRHEVHLLTVGAVGEIMEETRSRLKASLDDEMAKVASVDARKQELETAIKEADDQVSSVEGEKTDKDTAFAAAQTTVGEKAAALTEAQAAEVAGNAELEKLKADKEVAASAYESNFKPLRDEELEACVAQKHLDMLSSCISHMNVDASLLTTLPAACLKPKGSRGSFDTMVFDELDKSFSAYITGLSEKISAASPAAEERAATVAAAQTGLEEAKLASEAAKGEVEKAQARLADASAAATAAKTVLAEFMPEHKSATQLRDEKLAALKGFEEHQLPCFAELRDKTEVKPEPEAPADLPAKEVGAAPSPVSVEVGGA